jgi:hypothetical protein
VMPATLILFSQAARQRAHQWIDRAPDGFALILRPPTRTDEQNRKLWPMLQDISRQVDWYGQKLTKEEWKDVLTAGLKRSRIVPGIDGGFVVLGLRTSSMSKREFSELIELIMAFGTQHGVKWSDPAEIEK